MVFLGNNKNKIKTYTNKSQRGKASMQSHNDLEKCEVILKNIAKLTALDFATVKVILAKKKPGDSELILEELPLKISNIIRDIFVVYNGVKTEPNNENRCKASVLSDLTKKLPDQVKSLSCKHSSKATILAKLFRLYAQFFTPVSYFAEAISKKRCHLNGLQDQENTLINQREDEIAEYKQDNGYNDLKINVIDAIQNKQGIDKEISEKLSEQDAEILSINRAYKKKIDALYSPDIAEEDRIEASINDGIEASIKKNINISYYESFFRLKENLTNKKKTYGFKIKDSYISLNEFLFLYSKELPSLFVDNCSGSIFAKALSTINLPNALWVWNKSFNLLLKKGDDNWNFSDFQKLIALGLYFKKYHSATWDELNNTWKNKIAGFLGNLKNNSTPIEGQAIDSVFEKITKYLFSERISSRDMNYLDHLINTLMEADDFERFKESDIFQNQLIIEYFKGIEKNLPHNSLTTAALNKHLKQFKNDPIVREKSTKDALEGGLSILKNLKKDKKDLDFNEMMKWKKETLAILEKEKDNLTDDVKKRLKFGLDRVDRVEIYGKLCDSFGNTMLNTLKSITKMKVSEDTISISDVFSKVPYQKRVDFFEGIAKKSPLLLRNILNNPEFLQETIQISNLPCILIGYLERIGKKKEILDSEVMSALIIFRIFQKHFSKMILDELKPLVKNITTTYLQFKKFNEEDQKKVKNELNDFIEGKTTSISYRVLQVGSFEQWAKNISNPNIFVNLFNFFKEPSPTPILLENQKKKMAR